MYIVYYLINFDIIPDNGCTTLLPPKSTRYLLVQIQSDEVLSPLIDYL